MPTTTTYCKRRRCYAETTQSLKLLARTDSNSGTVGSATQCTLFDAVGASRGGVWGKKCFPAEISNQISTNAMAKAITVALLIAACIALAGIASAAPVASIALPDEELDELLEGACMFLPFARNCNHIPQLQPKKQRPPLPLHPRPLPPKSTTFKNSTMLRKLTKWHPPPSP